MTKLCPLCKKVLLEIGPEPWDYICQTRIKLIHNAGATVSHYEDRDDSNHIRMRVGDYEIFNHRHENKSHVYIYTIFKNNNPPHFPPIYKQQEIFSTVKIEPDEPEKLLKRLKLLTVFS